MINEIVDKIVSYSNDFLEEHKDRIIEALKKAEPTINDDGMEIPPEIKVNLKVSLTKESANEIYSKPEISISCNRNTTHKGELVKFDDQPDMFEEGVA